MVKSIEHKGVRIFFESGSKAGIQPHHVEKLRVQLASLNQAKKPEDMGVPSWGLHLLQGSMAGHWSVTVNGNWRLTFKFEGGDVVLVNYQDYH